MLPELPTEARYIAQPEIMPLDLRCAVVVPARDEARRILTCLEAIRCEWSLEGQQLTDQVLTVLVINGTTDDTAYRVLQWNRRFEHVPLVVVDANFSAERAHVGSARALGMEIAEQLLGSHSSLPRHRQLLFSTDADSRLAHDAVARGLLELELADAFGAHIMAGETDTSRIGMMFNQYNRLKGMLRHELYPCAHDRNAPHGVFGGAGFGVSCSTYTAVGGLPELAFDEDQAMRRRLLEGGFRVSYPTDIVVYTSTRTTGRTPWGMAQQLVAWEQEPANYWPLVPAAEGLAAKYRLKAKLRDSWRAAGRLEKFELCWAKYWRSTWVQTEHAELFPLMELPTAADSLRSMLSEYPKAQLNQSEEHLVGTVEYSASTS